jgi:hypothetical protein
MGKTYYVDSVALNRKKGSVFAFEDPELTTVAKFHGLTLMFDIEEIVEKLK